MTRTSFDWNPQGNRRKDRPEIREGEKSQPNSRALVISEIK